MNAEASLSNIERQAQLLRFIQQRSRATVNELALEFGVSVATVRRDLDALAEQGVVTRFHGGAVAVRQAPPEQPVLQRNAEQAEEKERIGRAAAGLIEDGDTIFLGSGTTVLAVAKHLRTRRDLTVITNSVLVLNELSSAPYITVVGLGGLLRSSEMSLIGHITEQALAEVRVQKIIMGIHAIDVEHGLTNDYLPETMTDRAILGQGGRVIIVADHSKCGRVSIAFLAPLSAIDTLVTDSGAPPDFIAAVAEQPIDVLVV
jgi:DeoR/GlpR family transcriptional regulator of sugar metabolism